LTIPTDSDVIVGLDRADDAGVYRISKDLALIQTVDFFTPVVDDPFQFGRIAAANAFSDIYAMGGVPKTAMNLVAFPLQSMDISILRRIIEGGISVIAEAGAVLIGGHSIEDTELKYGLSVTGFIHPDRVLVKQNLHGGDALILTKPLGTGIVSTAMKGGLASAEAVETISRQMAELNRRAAEIMGDYPVHACTDVTGFGFIGHLAEMVVGSGCSVRVRVSDIPILKEAREYAAIGLIPAGAYRNREYRSVMVDVNSDVDPITLDVLYDPQTSGGLLICLPADRGRPLVEQLVEEGVSAAQIVGEVIADAGERIRVV
jgi:selenide,water dikinase